MIDCTEAPYRLILNDDFILRTAVDEDDVERVAQFNGSIHGPGVVGMTRNIFLFHPDTRGRDLIFVEDRRTGQVLSSLCLIPWRWRYAGDVLDSGEMGIVGTLEQYRRRGLIRAQTEFFKIRLRERGCVLSHIQGIPFYYRQFGYEYALPLEGGLRLTRRDLPEMPDIAFTFRIAALDDLPILMRLYDQTASGIGIRTLRDESIWRYLMQHGAGTEMECETWIIQDARRHAVGYMRLPKHHFGDELTINEVSHLGFDAAVAVLHHLVDLADQRHAPGVRLCLLSNSTLMRVARSFGAHDMGTYAWQINVPDFAALLRAISPSLEVRVADSPFSGMTRDVPICFYRHTVVLRFVVGKLLEVADMGFTGNAAINIPPQAFIPLLLGYRSVEEVCAAYPDVNVRRAFRLLIETLFPRMPAFLYTIY